MERRLFLTGALALLGAPIAAEGHQTGRVYRIGLLFAGDPARSPQLQGLYSGLRELGYVQGQNIRVELRAAEGRYERLPGLATELANLTPDVIVTSATPAALAAKNATRTIPIVALVVGDPVGAGLVNSLGRPEGNVTGLSVVNVELGVKRLDLVKQLIPRVARIAVLRNPLNGQHERDLTATQPIAASLGVTLQVLDARQPEDIAPALKRAISEHAEILVALADSLFFSHRRTIIEFARASRLPDVHPYREMAVEGALMSYGLNLTGHYREGAAYVHRILRGARPADLPFQQPTNFELVINLKTAKALGLTIPQSLLLRADQIIE